MFGFGPMEMVIVGTIGVVLFGTRLPSTADALRNARHRPPCQHCGWMSPHPTHCQHCGRLKHPRG